MEEKAIRGVPWTVLSFASTKFIAVATTFVLARLLVPSDFGLIALAALAVGVMSLFSDLGLGAVLIARQDLDERDKGTVLTLMIATGAAVSAIVAALSPLAAAFFDEPRLTGILSALGVTALLRSPAWFYEALIERELEFRRRFAGQVVETLVYAMVAVTWAAVDASVWSLVAGQLASAATYLGAVLILSGSWVRPRFDPGVVRAVLRGGSGFMVQTAVAFAQRNTDYFALGRFLGAAEVGVYAMAYRMAELPYWAITNPVATVTFPAFARMRDRGEDVNRSFLSVLRLVALVACPLCIALSAASEPLVRTLLGDKWLAVIGPLAVLGVWGALVQVESTVGWLFNSVGYAGLNAMISGLLLLPLIPGLLLAAALGGVAAVAWVMLGNMVVALLAFAWFAHRRLGVVLRRQWEALRPVAIACAVSWVAGRAAADATAGGTALVSLAISAAAALGTYAAVVSLVEPGVLRQARGQLGRTIGRPAPAPGS